MTQHESLQLRLNALNRQRLQPDVPFEGTAAGWERELSDAAALAAVEVRFLERERADAAAHAATAPAQRDAFVDWFIELRRSGPGQHHPLFDYIEHEASAEQLRWFIRQEVAGEAGFDDLVALTQLRMPVRAKLEMARNYWDEMGRGKQPAMHGPLLGNLARALQVDSTPPEAIVWESLALANIMAGLAFHRRYAFHSVGALGVIELTAPTRALKVANGLERVGVSRDATRYFRLHATVDCGHSRAWNDEVLGPLLTDRPELARHLAEGAIMRLHAGARTFDRYCSEFSLAVAAPALV